MSYGKRFPDMSIQQLALKNQLSDWAFDISRLHTKVRLYHARPKHQVVVARVALLLPRLGQSFRLTKQLA
jgi:hypothetical protein